MKDDLISRQAAIDAFMASTSDGDKAEWCEWVLKQVSSAQQWIPVTQSLPTQYGSYLVSMRDDAFVYWQVGISTFNPKDKKWSFYDNSFGLKIIAWMHLPEPYKMVGEDG